MFHSSTQKSHWLFQHRQQLTRQRAETNASFCRKYSDAAISKECQFLTPTEEESVCLYYMKKLFEFCNVFRPPVPRGVLGTAGAYFKRFYLLTSVMDYHPKEIFLSCAYLAFKIEEYNVSLDEFVYMLSPELRQSSSEMILNNELMMLKRLKFHLTIHSPFRPLEGFLIDMKTRSSIPNVERLRKEADSFLMSSLYSDVLFLYPPSQIALAALYYASTVIEVDISSYIKVQLADTIEQGSKLAYTLQGICDIVRTVFVPESSQEIAHILQRLEKCSRVVLVSPPTNSKRKSDEVSEVVLRKKIKEEHDVEETGLTSLTGFGSLT
ncbi:PREDICTED: cyclin-H-like [Amphimedon queenslandica]|uniref:Cyclin-H n=1 Tax=Amphimedon queenslandica TaxID=400682 RepID=A0A1X7UMZ2_AMPQE|nr:PREDICTED: cyclin-H-like [Amphimedon queenslandica]|eukprot:XP_019853410.1 PREDICTED: cyclin-H-like [Amphimedon queenslandica]